MKKYIKPIHYELKRLYVNIDTGEEITGEHKEIKKMYNILKVEKKVSFNYNTRKEEQTWLLQNKPQQTKLF